MRGFKQPYNMSEYKKVYIAKDNDGHNYVIPYELKDEFNKLLELSESEEYSEYDESDMVDNELAFAERFEKYMTGGSVNLVELYAIVGVV